jgi:phenylpyruvate tautomerase PptA (4-oxalocrotonate tautomerase family)
VEVKVLKQVPQATQVMVEPASPDDWEIVVPRRKQLFCPYRVAFRDRVH